MPLQVDTMKQLRELITKRSSVKGQITKFKTYLTSLSTKVSLTSIEIAELNLKISKLESLSAKFEDVQSEIEVLNADNLDREMDERESIECDIITYIATAKNLIERQTQLDNDYRRNSLANDTRCSLDHHDSGIRLPRIQIAKFDGAFFRWLEFRDTYESLIHKNDRIQSIQKFHYLLSYLEGDAAKILSNFEVSSSNYDEAWKLLCERYNNKRSLINQHLGSLFNIQKQNSESERSLRFVVDHVTKNLRALSSLGEPTDKWDTLIIYMVASKLDSRTLLKWEEYRNTLSEMPTLSQFFKFLISRADVLESINRSKYSNDNFKSNQSTSKPVHSQQEKDKRYSYTKSFASTSECKYPCIICNSSDHRIYDCLQFKSKNIKERLDEVHKHNLCKNCLRQGHSVKDCRLGPCRICKKRHNTLLHNPNATVNNNLVQSEEVANFSGQNNNLVQSEEVANFSGHVSTQVILSTAMINVCNQKTGQLKQVRALLDCGSQSSFMTRSLKEKLGLHSKPIQSIKIIGIGNHHSNNAIESCTVTIQSLCSSYSNNMSCLILNELTSELPKVPINKEFLNIPSYIQLADPTFDRPAPVDILIGADLFWDLLGNNEFSLSPSGPKLRSSKLGWLVSGPVQSKQTYNKIQNNQKLFSNHAITNATIDNLDNELTKFWELEELPKKTYLNDNDKVCEDHFQEHTFRLQTGRFCVKLPLIDSPDCLGDSYSIAKKRFLLLEQRFKKNPQLKAEYSSFIQEYKELGHLSESPIPIPSLNYFFCHHAVLKQNSESTKLRVVFDGSAPTSSGLSLNDILMVGPSIQNSLFSILIRSRQYKYLLTGDIEKMYRQVLVNEDDRNLQLILWRENQSQPIQTLRLNTLTYGTACASYLSTRCLHQIGEEQDDEMIKTIIQNDLYVDDVITGSNDSTHLRFIQKSLAEAFSAGCFNLRKYKSNLPNLLDDTNINTQENLTISESSNTLGLGWSPASDTLHFPIQVPIDSNKITKRFIMSNAFKIFDPLGLLSPCIIIPKMLLQRLWQQRLHWDEPVPKDIQTEWQRFAHNLKFLSKLNIQRPVLCDQPKRIELHTFSDASQRGFGACIYMRSINAQNKVQVRLLCSKSKVAPMKPTTMPRLELCAALLSIRLYKSVIESIRYKPDQVYHWCDSSIVLAWLTSDPRSLKAFVANRICEILESSSASSWRYVPTASNPADLISRGVDCSQIIGMELWWSGPSYLLESESNWPNLNKPMSNKILPEVKSNSVLIDNFIDFNNYSNLNRLQNTFAYIHRFIHNLKNPNNKRSGIITIEELDASFRTLCTISQKQSFPIEYETLAKQLPLSSKSKILSLSPFIDENKLIRVGGRIEASDCTYERKHPILLHASNNLTKLIFQREHIRNLHAGPQLLLATVREIIWPINGRYLARRTFNKCVRCRRIQGKTLCPKMGNLPRQRITPDFPFLSVGLDFAGPFYILNRRGRGSRITKCYLCLFVCLRFKCIHLECVSDLSKESFVMTLKRFIARRGKPSEIFCDNGRNFVAAAKEVGQFLKNHTEPLSNFANQEGIKFVFTPTYAPHFGGIWEAGVKSAKYHAKRVIGNSHLTFEELTTLFAQIESILNSRPLYPLSSSPYDLLSLTPGHFLIGRPLTAIASPNLENATVHSLKRYARLEQIRQHFWRRWSNEYVSELQQRSKWRKDTSRLNVGDLVLLQEDNLPPLNWRLGRVTRLFMGADGIARVADVHTTRGTVRRPLVRLCPLPNEEELTG